MPVFILYFFKNFPVSAPSEPNLKKHGLHRFLFLCRLYTSHILHLFTTFNKFRREKSLNFEDSYRILVPSREPNDKKYVGFINALNLGVAMVDERMIRAIGEDKGFSRI